jgi:hypothetical protein
MTEQFIPNWYYIVNLSIEEVKDLKQKGFIFGFEFLDGNCLNLIRIDRHEQLFLLKLQFTNRLGTLSPTVFRD